MLSLLTKRLKANRGFTMAEMVIVVAVLAILVTVSTPVIFQFMRQRDQQNEESAQQEIRKAIQAYLADKSALPDDTTDWATALAGYTNLSRAQIATDGWRNPRTYIMYLDSTRNIMGTPVPIYYVTVFSSGVNGKAENKIVVNGTTTTVSGVAITGTAFAGSTNSGWWARNGDRVANFSTVQPGGDDQMMRFTDYPEKLDRYNLTTQRLDRLSQAIETFARSGYAERVAACGDPSLTKDANGNITDPTWGPLCNNGAPEVTVYYPKATAIEGGTDSAVYKTNTVIVNNNQGDAARRTDMQKLVRMLGLPDEFCCSALENGSDSKAKPFYYFSNPRPRGTSGSCTTRPGAADNKLPARLTTQYNADSTSSPTCG